MLHGQGSPPTRVCLRWHPCQVHLGLFCHADLHRNRVGVGEGREGVVMSRGGEEAGLAAWSMGTTKTSVSEMAPLSSARYASSATLTC